MIREKKYRLSLGRYGSEKERGIRYASNRLLITVRVIKSTGALKLVVNADEQVQQVVCNVLKCYARQGRFPFLGFDYKHFQLYPALDSSQALDPSKRIGDVGTRSFLMLRNEMILFQKEEERIRNRMLITVNVMRSTVVVKLVVNVNDSIERVVENALKCYARQGYLPLLGLDSQRFQLYSIIDSSQPLEACQYIGECGNWNFVMTVKQIHYDDTESNVKCRKSSKWKNLLRTMGFLCFH